MKNLLADQPIKCRATRRDVKRRHRGSSDAGCRHSLMYCPDDSSPLFRSH